MYLLINVFLAMGRFVGRLYARGKCSLPLMYHPVHAEKWHKWAWRGWIGGRGECWVPLHQTCQSQTWLVKGGMWTHGPYTQPTHPPIHPHTNPSHPTTHPSTHSPTTLSPTHPFVPITSEVLLLLLLHPLAYPPIHPPIHPLIPVPYLSCQMSSHIIDQHPFRIQN